jgi:two-component system phosphate regulon sensor histidine kinase PhoR
MEAEHLIQRVLEVFWDRAAKKKISLSYSLPSGLPLILGDYDRLQQLFINLVDNAVKYTPSGGSVILTATEAHLGAQADAAIEIRVTDTGAGIAEKDLPRLTERFYRVDKARSRELGGTGLGLAIVKHIVLAHGGELKIESALNHGTTVRVFLPVVAADTNPEAVFPSQVSAVSR